MQQFVSLPPVYRWLITLVVIVIVVALSITPGKSQADDSMFIWLLAHTPTLVQKIMHITCYAVVAALWVWTLEAIESNVLRLSLALALTIGLGIFLEWYQTMVPGRFGTIVDVILNAIGAMVGLLMAIFLL
jgi:VanZ family protein